MKLRLPLYGQILGWFLLNLGLLTTLAAAFWLARAPWALEALWNRAASDRMDALASAVSGELATQNRAEWTATLARFSQAYATEMALINAEGETLAGPALTLPAEVRARLRFPRPRRDRPPPPLDGRRPPFESGPRGDEPGFGPGPEEGPPRPLHPKFMVRAGAPPKYWIGARLGELARHAGKGGVPALVLVADTLWGDPLLDWQPWAFAAAAAVLISALFWVPFARGVTSAISRMAQATERLADGDFGAAAAVPRRDELGRLADSINRLGGRLEHYVHGQRRFLGDVAHELCSPLARLELSLELAGRLASPAQQISLEDAREELRQMSSLVEELLAFSKAGLRRTEAALEPVELEPLLAAVVEREGAEPGRVRIASEPGLFVLAQPDLLRRALGNLVRNAIRHGGGTVDLTARSDGARVTILVADGGPGVPTDALSRLGEPFYRPDSSRARETGGVGLGLAIVKACAEACRGRLEFRNRTPTGFEAALSLESAGRGPRKVAG